MTENGDPPGKEYKKRLCPTRRILNEPRKKKKRGEKMAMLKVEASCRTESQTENKHDICEFLSLEAEGHLFTSKRAYSEEKKKGRGVDGEKKTQRNRVTQEEKRDRPKGGDCRGAKRSE